MESKKNKLDVAGTERLFQDLVDSGLLSFPRLEEPTPTQRDALSARMKKALQEKTSGGCANAPELFRARRMELELSIFEVANKADVSANTYRALEDGSRAPTDLRPEKLARVLHILDVTFSTYLDVHSSSLRISRIRSKQKRAALKGQRGKASAARRHSRSWSDWLMRLNIKMELL